MPKEVKHVKTHVPESTFASLLSGWVQQGVENFLATQKILVDLAMRQNTGVVNFVRERVADPGYCPVALMTEVVRVGDFTPAVAVTDLVHRSLDTFVEMHQEFLKNASKQTHAWLAAVKAGKTYDPEGLVEMARDSFDTFVHTQKKFLNVVAEETTKATGGNGAVKKTKVTEMTELAQQATDSFIEAQKKLIDLAGKQVNVSLKAAGRTLGMVAPFSVNPLPEIARTGVKTFIDTEKALLDTVTKRTEKKAVKVEGHRKRPVRTIKMKVQHAVV